MFLKKPFYIGKARLPNNIFYAPLAGCSDFPFRKMSAKYGPGLMYCEMVKMDALVRNDPGTLEMLKYSEEMRPIGGQICGSKPEIAGHSAKIIEDLGFNVIDLNCGCPVDKVTKDGSGSGLLKTPQKIGEIISQMVAAVKIPVTVKIRAGWDDENINAVEVMEIAEAAGAKAICIHGRTREQAYRGPANWDHIKACKARAKTILVIGNGDLFDATSAKRMFEYTGCDAVLVSRGTMGQPWIVQEMIADLENKQQSSYSSLDHLIEHFEWLSKVYPERKAALEMRRVGCWYIKSTFGARNFRETLHKTETIAEIRALLNQMHTAQEGCVNDI